MTAHYSIMYPTLASCMGKAGTLLRPSMPQPPNFDTFWPQSVEFRESPIPPEVKEQLEPPFGNLRRLLFRNATPTSGFGTISRPASRSGNPPAFFGQRDAWRLQSFGEMRFFNSCTEVIPEGMIKIRIPRTTKSGLFDKPVLYRLPYRHKNTRHHTLHSSPSYYDDCFESTEPLARENLASSRSSYLVLDGHLEVGNK